MNIDKEHLRCIVRKDSDLRLANELKGAQTVLDDGAVDKLSRAELVAMVTQLRWLNQSTGVCKNVMDAFDPSDILVISTDNIRSTLGSSSDTHLSGEAATQDGLKPTDQPVFQTDYSFKPNPTSLTIGNEPNWFQIFLTSREEDRRLEQLRMEKLEQARKEEIRRLEQERRDERKFEHDKLERLELQREKDRQLEKKGWRKIKLYF